MVALESCGIAGNNEGECLDGGSLLEISFVSEHNTRYTVERIGVRDLGCALDCAELATDGLKELHEVDFGNFENSK